MLYRQDKNGKEISLLGYGCMRFTKKGTGLDFEKAEKEIMAAYERGVNYYDTAYIYSGSEALIGEIFEKNGIRDKISIATKLPQYMIRNREAIDTYFNEQLSRLRTDYIDYYLMHMLTDVEAWRNLKMLGIEEWIADMKAKGKIKNIGFSYHGNTDMFLEILNDYDWDFCQIQYNYLDETTQAGVAGLKAAYEKSVPVIIMEPLRGGKLVNGLPDKAKKEIEQSPRGWTAAEMGLRWLWNQPEVTCVLSGMNSVEMVEENCRIASDATVGHFTDEDYALVASVKEAIREVVKVGCTGCRYCMPCPFGVDIPAIFSSYNNMFTDGKMEARFEFARMMGVRKDPAFADLCKKCGKCEQHCPQHIPIREKLVEADKALRPLPFKIGINVARKFMLEGRKEPSKKK
ncbi:MAG: aldo/keto reductase [Lachnospiraceae bacterium]|nr:aldo/keto reductase [Lachnospiraceae bacterium]